MCPVDCVIADSIMILIFLLVFGMFLKSVIGRGKCYVRGMTWTFRAYLVLLFILVADLVSHCVSVFGQSTSPSRNVLLSSI